MFGFTWRWSWHWRWLLAFACVSFVFAIVLLWSDAENRSKIKTMRARHNCRLNNESVIFFSLPLARLVCWDTWTWHSRRHNQNHINRCDDVVAVALLKEVRILHSSYCHTVYCLLLAYQCFTKSNLHSLITYVSRHVHVPLNVLKLRSREEHSIYNRLIELRIRKHLLLYFVSEVL